MDLASAVELRSQGRAIMAGSKENHFEPVHAGAHSHFMKIGYMHTGNKNRGGIKTSEYFKTKNGNSRTVSVQADGSYVKLSRTAKGQRRLRGKMDANGMKCHMSHHHPHHHSMMRAANDVKPDHMAEYQNLMKQSAAHQRAADALAQSHQEEDRPLYEHHAGKAWRLGNKAMEHFKRMTKEQRSMLKDKHWDTSQPQQGFGKKKVVAAKTKACSCDHENWQHSTDGSCNVIGCDCTGKKVAAGGPGSGRHKEDDDSIKVGDVVHHKSQNGYELGQARVKEIDKNDSEHPYLIEHVKDGSKLWVGRESVGRGMGKIK